MTEETTAPEAATEEQPQGLTFGLKRVYIKDLSFETPQGLNAFAQEWKPNVDQEVNNAIAKIDDTHYEVVLTMTVKVSLNDKIVFLIEVQQAGLFMVQSGSEQHISHALNTLAPQTLFPYAREAVDNIVVKGSFPALMLPPINWDTLYADAVRQQQQQAAENPESVN